MTEEKRKEYQAKLRDLSLRISEKKLDYKPKTIKEEREEAWRFVNKNAK